MGVIYEKYMIVKDILWNSFGILSFLVTKGEVISKLLAEHDIAEKVITEKLLCRFCEQEKLLKAKKYNDTIVISVTEDESNVYFAGLRLDRENLLITGPMSNGTLSFVMKQGFLYSRKITNEHFPIPQINYSGIFGIFQIIYYITFHEWKKSNEFYTALDEPKENSFQQMEYHRQQLENEIQRHPYKVEREFYESIKSGKIRNQMEESSVSINKATAGIGVLSAKGMNKQLEYMVVSMVTLATRAAIEGGVPPIEAYEISDLILQECSTTFGNEHYLQLLHEATMKFTKRVNYYQHQEHMDSDVERVKNYVAGHLFEKIEVQEIAKAHNISYSYLSAKFKKKTGKSMKEYIVMMKLKAVENYLRYSDSSIGEIAEYMSFSSASRMAGFFSKAYGMTPTQYRERYYVVDYSENNKNG